MTGITGSDTRPATILESASRGADRVPLLVLLVLLPLVSWSWIVVMARDMYRSDDGRQRLDDDCDMGCSPSAAALGDVDGHDGWHDAAVRLTDVAAVRRRRATIPHNRRQRAMSTRWRPGYLMVWIAFSLGATVLQRLLARLLLVSPMMEATSVAAGAALLCLAGVYQLTPNQTHLPPDVPVTTRISHEPLAYREIPGAFSMGLEHGAFCVGCCWALMLLLFVGGVMNVTVIAALTALVAFERLAPFGMHSALISGVLLIASALWMLLR